MILGGGGAGIGIARVLRGALREAGLQGDDLFRSLAIVDRDGLLVDDLPLEDAEQREFAWPAALAARVRPWRPASRAASRTSCAPCAPRCSSAPRGRPARSAAAAIELMAAQARRPVILPLSNPTACSEAVPEDVMAWTDGRALVATGSPFPEVVMGRRRRRSIAQANNAFVFPAMGLASVVGQVREVTDGMFRATAEALAKEVTADDLRRGRLLPRVQDLRAVTARLAAAVLRHVRASGGTLPFPESQTEAAVAAAMWEPRYAALEPAPERRARR